MTQTTDKPCNLSIWQLVHLGHELDDLAGKITLLANLLNSGHVDQKLFKRLRRQIDICGTRLEQVQGTSSNVFRLER